MKKVTKLCNNSLQKVTFAASLKEILKSDKYDVDKGFKLIYGNISVQDKIVTIPLYMAFLIN